jgi:lysophospholipase L1-like esterase
MRTRASRNAVELRGVRRVGAPGSRSAGLAALLLAAASLAACSLDRPNPTTVYPPPGPTAASTEGPSVTPGEGLRYVALGDSYTIGTSVTEAERWPNQLVARVPELELVANLAVNGFTSRDVIEVELPQLDALRPDFITLLIGVNDVVQGVPVETYRANVQRILDDAVDRVGASRVLVVTTPDYTVTPSGADYGDPVRQAAAIREFNQVLLEVTLIFAIRVVDIHDISLEARTDRTLVASDGLHPSGAQYALWVDRIEQAVGTLLMEEAH